MVGDAGHLESRKAGESELAEGSSHLAELGLGAGLAVKRTGNREANGDFKQMPAEFVESALEVFLPMVVSIGGCGESFAARRRFGVGHEQCEPQGEPPQRSEPARDRPGIEVGGDERGTQKRGGEALDGPPCLPVAPSRGGTEGDFDGGAKRGLLRRAHGAQESAQGIGEVAVELVGELAKAADGVEVRPKPEPRLPECLAGRVAQGIFGKAVDGAVRVRCGKLGRGDVSQCGGKTAEEGGGGVSRCEGQRERTARGVCLVDR